MPSSTFKSVQNSSNSLINNFSVQYLQHRISYKIHNFSNLSNAIEPKTFIIFNKLIIIYNLYRHSTSILYTRRNIFLKKMNTMLYYFFIIILFLSPSCCSCAGFVYYTHLKWVFDMFVPLYEIHRPWKKKTIYTHFKFIMF